MDSLLLLTLLVPLAGSLIHPLLPVGKNASFQNGAALLIASVMLGLTISLWVANPSASAYQMVLPWLPTFGISFALGVDGLSQTLLTLTSVLTFVAVLSSITQITKRHRFYYSMLFLLIASVMAVFTARDLFLFFLAFELELIPMYFLIAVWGGPRREFAAMKFVLYTLFGSIFLVAAILGLYFFAPKGIYPGVIGVDQLFLFDNLKTGIEAGMLPVMAQLLIFAGFFIAFSVKLPVVPLHTWLPDAHVEAPTPISMLLAGILLKMGAYGMLRFCFEWLPGPAHVLSPYLAVLALISIIYTGGVALVQKDMKKLIAYSSVSHMGFALLGLACLNEIGFSAATFIMVSHGLVSAALFMCVGVLYRRTHSRLIADHAGAAQKAPALFYFFMLFSMASLGLPFLISFAGESLVFYGAMISSAFQSIPLGAGFSLNQPIQQIALYAVFGVVLGAGYMLWLLKRLFFEELSPKCEKLTDISLTEGLALGVLALFTVGFGLWPQGLLQGFSEDMKQIAQPYRYFSLSQQGTDKKQDKSNPVQLAFKPVAVEAAE